MPESGPLGDINQTIHPLCEMFSFASSTSGPEAARDYYFRAARFLLERLLKVVEEAGIDPASSAILDFAAGYGRFSRLFVRCFRRVTTADLDPRMIEFCSRELGTESFLSSTDPRAIRPTPDYDVVFAFSLFTHLPEGTWRTWLQILWAFVRPGGMLVFSTRSPALSRSMDAAASRVVPQAVLELPNQICRERLLHVYGVRLTAAAPGSLRVGVHIRSASHAKAESVELDRSRDLLGTELGIPTAEIVRGADADTLIVEIPFRGPPVADLPIGPVRIRLSFDPPGAASIDGHPEGPTVTTKESLASAMEPGIRFRAANETGGRIDVRCYGSTTVTTEYVEAAIHELDAHGRVRHFPGGDMDLYQDVFAVEKTSVGWSR